MAKKKQPPAPKAFDSNPFNALKGFAVSAKPRQPQAELPPAGNAQSADTPVDFAEEMALLEVQRLEALNDEEAAALESQLPLRQQPQPTAALSDKEEFLQALGDLEIRFCDQFPDDEQPRPASARRMKLLKQGKLSLQASLDLHGLTRPAVAERLRFFLQDAQYHGWSTLLVITGKGLNSESGEAVLRHEAERFLAGEEGASLVTEWGRAPKEHGGDGALVLFLRKSPG